MDSDKHWFATLVVQIKINSTAYILKLFFLIGILVIIRVCSGDFVSKVLSIITYTAGIAIDSYFLNRQCTTNSLKLVVFLYFHMLIIWAGTVALIIALIAVFIDTAIINRDYFIYINEAVNLFTIYATSTPLLEAIVNCNNNQLTNQKEGKKC